MSRTPSRSDRKADDADVSYNIATLFTGRDTAIHLFKKDNNSVEVLIAKIPEPDRYYNNYNTDDREKLDQHAIGRWIVEDSARELEKWDYNTSSYKTNSGNRHLRDVYFECDRSEINEAIIKAKRFVNTFEQKVFEQNQRIGKDPSSSPLQDLSE